MQVTITAQDNISSALARMVDGAGRQGLMEAIGQAVVSQTKLAFDNAGQRPAAWPARTTGGSHALLKLSGTLQRGIAISSLTETSVSVSSDRIYAALHQFGGKIQAKNGGYLKFKIGDRWTSKKEVTIPARPFFPVTPGGELTLAAKERIAAVVRIKLKGLAKGG